MLNVVALEEHEQVITKQKYASLVESERVFPIFEGHLRRIERQLKLQRSDCPQLLGKHIQDKLEELLNGI